MSLLFPPELIDIVVSHVADNSPWYFVSKRYVVVARKNRVSFKLSCKLGRWVDIHSRLNTIRKYTAEYYIYRYGHSKLFDAISTRSVSEHRERGIMRSGDVDLLNGLLLIPTVSPEPIELKPKVRTGKHMISASKSGNLEMLKAVIAIQRKAFEKNEYEHAAYYAAKMKGKTGDSRYNDIITLLKQHGKKQSVMLSTNIAHGLVESGNVQELSMFLASNSILIGNVAVRYACRSGNMSMLSFVLDRYPIGDDEKYVWSLIIDACYGKNVAIVGFIINLAKDHFGYISLSSSEKDMVANITCNKGNLDMVKLLDRHGLFNHDLGVKYASWFGAFDILLYSLDKCDAVLVIKSALTEVVEWNDKATAMAILDRLIR